MMPIARTPALTSQMWHYKSNVEAVDLSPDMPVVAELWYIYYQLYNHSYNKLHAAICRGLPYENVACKIVKVAPYIWLLNSRTNQGLTALHLATYKRLTKVVRTLLLRGADPLIEDRNGNNALASACSIGCLELTGAFMNPLSNNEKKDFTEEQARLLSIRVLSCLDKKNYAGETCLHIAVAANNQKLAKMLLESGANPNAQTSTSGYTALHIAIDNENRIMVDILLAYDANVNARTFHGRSVLEMASSSNEEMILTLVAAGAMPALDIFASDVSSDLLAICETEEESNDDRNTV